jgi:hypothetical protein
MAARRPDLLDRLYRPFPVDRRGEVPEGKAPFYEAPVFNDVEILPFCGGVAAQMGVGRAEPETEVIDVPELVSLRVLRAGVAEIGADAPIGGGAFDDRPVFNGHAAQQYKAAPVEDLGAKPLQHRHQIRHSPRSMLYPMPRALLVVGEAQELSFHIIDMGEICRDVVVAAALAGGQIESAAHERLGQTCAAKMNYSGKLLLLLRARRHLWPM